MRSNQISANNLNGLGILTSMAKAPTLAQRRSRPRERPGNDTGRPSTAVPGCRRGLLERIDQWLWRQQQRSVEAYLAQATDVFDVEARLRALERNDPYPYY